MDYVLKGFPESSYHHITVLYVEDDAFSREKLVRILERRFAKVLVAMDGEEGFQMFQKHKPDLVIADIKMNKMTGLEMIEKIRQLNDQVQVIVTTAYEDSEYLLQSLEQNVNHFILKPIDLEKLLLAIRKSIYHIQLEKELVKQKNLCQVMMDSQEDLIFVMNNGQIIDINRSFASFTGINNYPLPSMKSLLTFFRRNSNYFYPENQDNWVDEFFSIHHGKAKVKWIGKDGYEKIFLMKAVPIPNEKQYLFSCKDISELESESRRIELLSTFDPITKTFNRMKFDEILSGELKRSERYCHPFSLIMFDIDDFKKIDDQFGYKKCDEILETLSTIVQQRIRESDVFARWGDKEFILLTPEENKFNAAVLAESIRALIKGFEFQEIGPLTCSFGVTEFSSGKTKQQLLRELGFAVHESKNKGKNIVTIYHEKEVNTRKEGAQGA